MKIMILSYALVAGMLLSVVLVGALLIQGKTISRFNLIVFLFIFLIGSSSLMQGTDWKDWIYLSLSIIAYQILFQFYHDRFKTLIIVTLLVLSAGVYMQLLQCVLHPEMWLVREEAIDRGYLLGGNYNQIGCRMLLAFALGLKSVQYSKWWYLNLIPLLIAGMTVQCMVQSMTSLSCIVLFLIVCLIRNKRLLRYGLVLLYSSWLFFQIFVCFQGNGLADNELAVWFIEDVLGKDITFTYRTDMWDSALHIIPSSPIWGYGFVDADWFYSNMSTRAIGAHNFILNTMVYGGVASIVLYVWMIVLSIHNLRKQNDINSLRLLAAFGILCVMMLFEAYIIPIVFLYLTIMYYYQPDERRD